MNILDANIGSAKDNMNSPVHNWYKFTAGFSYKFVDIILEDYHGQDITVYEPFAGCGTTLVECQKLGFRSVGNESQELMCGIIPGDDGSVTIEGISFLSLSEKSSL